LARVFVSHSANGDPYAAGVRDAVEARLAAIGHTPLVDRSLIHPGDRWRATLLTWLGTCDAAVILITGQAADSDWVRAECTILGWRAWLNPSMRIVPVLLDEGASSAVLDHLGLTPVAVREIQVLKVDDLTSRDPVIVARAVGACFEGYQVALRDRDPMSKWRLRVERHLDGNAFLEHAALRLGIHDEDIKAGESLAARVADRLLQSEAVPIEQAVDELTLDPGLPPRMGSFAPLVSCAWLPAEMADRLFAVAAAEPEHRVAWTMVARPTTAGRLVRRITCCDNGYTIVGPVSAAGTGSDDRAELLDRYAGAILSALGAFSEADWPSAYASLQKSKSKPVFVLLGEDALEAGVLTPLIARFQGLVFVCSGPIKDLRPDHAVELTPPLAPGREAEGGSVADRIENIRG
jgi:TIR domain-containing protein